MSKPNVIKPDFNAVERSILTLKNRAASLSLDDVCDILDVLEHSISSWEEDLGIDTAFIKITEARWWLENYGEE